MKKSDIKEKYDTFLSHVGVEQTNYSGAYGLWQYSWTGKIDGISVDVDLDYSYNDYPTIIKNAGLNDFSTSDTQSPTENTAEISLTVDGKTYSGTLNEK